MQSFFLKCFFSPSLIRFWIFSNLKQRNQIKWPKLQKIQNRGMRIILQCHPRTHIADMLSNLKWLSIKQRIMFLTAVLVFKIMPSKTPNYMSHWLVPVSHQYLFVPRSHQNSLTTKGTRLWNQLPTSIRALPNLKTFFDLIYFSKTVHVSMIIKHSRPPYWSPAIKDTIKGLVTLISIVVPKK